MLTITTGTVRNVFLNIKSLIVKRLQTLVQYLYIYFVLITPRSSNTIQTFCRLRVNSQHFLTVCLQLFHNEERNFTYSVWSGEKRALYRVACMLYHV